MIKKSTVRTDLQRRKITELFRTKIWITLCELYETKHLQHHSPSGISVKYSNEAKSQQAERFVECMFLCTFLRRISFSCCPPHKFIYLNIGKKYVFEILPIWVNRVEIKISLQHFISPKPLNPFLYYKSREMQHLQLTHNGLLLTHVLPN